MEIKVKIEVRRDHENGPVFGTFILESNKAFQLAKIKQYKNWNDLFQELEKIRDEE